MSKNLWQKAEEISKSFVNTLIVESKDSTGQSIFIAKIQELYGCMAQGASKDEALENLQDACIDYIYCLLTDNLEIPKPTQVIGLTSFSGLDKSVFNIVNSFNYKEKESNKQELYAVSLRN